MYQFVQNHIKNAKQPNFFYNRPSTLPKNALAKFYLSTTFGSSFMIRSVAPTRSSTFYSCLITKIGNRNLNYPSVTYPTLRTYDSLYKENVFKQFLFRVPSKLHFLF